jgi:hypothetical protein
VLFRQRVLDEESALLKDLQAIGVFQHLDRLTLRAGHPE